MHTLRLRACTHPIIPSLTKAQALWQYRHPSIRKHITLWCFLKESIQGWQATGNGRLGTSYCATVWYGKQFVPSTPRIIIRGIKSNYGTNPLKWDLIFSPVFEQTLYLLYCRSKPRCQYLTTVASPAVVNTKSYVNSHIKLTPGWVFVMGTEKSQIVTLNNRVH
jgi:hypothetical protein